ncbi:hypothetical protein J1N35_005326 [Gossypium stocksii]|uniref:Uncharacterized protein n=1 Tax=Gossypium stocksii TaxID=47602 RepID=A0A9D4AJ60_9ROSI|nr:hypothetical protein J1N35_005326 [Gossypium stocksii]
MTTSICLLEALRGDLLLLTVVTRKKASFIESYNQLRDKIGATTLTSLEDGEVLSDHYKLLAVDLRDIHIFAEFISIALQAMG